MSQKVGEALTINGNNVLETQGFGEKSTRLDQEFEEKYSILYWGEKSPHRFLETHKKVNNTSDRLYKFKKYRNPFLLTFKLQQKSHLRH